MWCAVHVFDDIRFVLVFKDFRQVVYGRVEDRDHLAIALKQVDDGGVK